MPSALADVAIELIEAAIRLNIDAGAGAGAAAELLELLEREEISAFGAFAAAESRRDEILIGAAATLRAVLIGERIAEGRRFVAAWAREIGAVATFAATLTGAVTTLVILPRRDTLDDFRPRVLVERRPREPPDHECLD